MTGDNALPLTAFALAFSPVCPLSVAAFAALNVSLWRRMSAVATGIFILTGENARANAESGRALSPVIKNNVAPPREESSDEFTS